ncbi:MAG: DUF2935 domain-containing protein [Bacilli bacterium]|nr:DUF2935 domain-containing protein [Bacilli bacterium]
MNNNEYIRLSLELHLFFDRIMKEHSLFLEAAFLEKDAKLKQVAQEFQKSFSNILNKIVYLANGNVTNQLLASNEIVTKNTYLAESQTRKLTGGFIDVDITLNELNLKSGRVKVTNELLNEISTINKQTIPLVENLIKFKNDILNSVLSCKLYTTNYPLLISHIMNEAKMYHNLLSRVESRSPFTKNELYEQEIFWNTIMKEHAEFIRGLLDPSEHNLILTADKYADEYKKIIRNYRNNPTYLTNASLNETIKFRDFKVTGEEGILNCKIKSIIIPLLADHVVREANHFIRILENINT